MSSAVGEVGVPPAQPMSVPLAVNSVAPPERRIRKSRREAGAEDFPVVWISSDFFIDTSTTTAGDPGKVPPTLSDAGCGRQDPAFIVELDPPDDLVRRNHVHAPRQGPDDVDAEVVGVVLLVAVAQRHRA